MGKLLKRSISGLVYSMLFIGAILYSKETYLILISTFGFICIWEFLKLLSLKNIAPYILFLTLISLLFSSYDTPLLIDVLLILCLSGSIQLLVNLFRNKNEYPSSSFQKLDISVRYLLLSFIFLMILPFKNGEYEESIILLLVVFVWSNDSFAFFVGKNLGKKKLFESVSPNKTVEGFIGGFFFTLIIAIIISKYIDFLSITQGVIIALMVSCFGTLGDLVESKFKRQVNLKDSGNLMPGHGGLLDRLDSLLFVSPFV